MKAQTFSNMIIHQKEIKTRHRTRKIYEDMSQWNLKTSEEKIMNFFVWLYTKKGQDNIITTQKTLKEMTFFNNYSKDGYIKILYRLRDKKYLKIETCEQFAQIKKYTLTNQAKEKIKNLTETEKNQFITQTPEQEQKIKEIIEIAKTKWK